jgi:hypothetical protein
MSPTQLSFSLRVSSGVKSVHLLGSWDNYAGQLPLSKDKTSSKSGSWKGTFRFSSSTLQSGQRYWYYYIVDGYHVAHDPSVQSCVEGTTGRELNILDVPKSSSSSKSHKSSSKSHKSSSSSSHRSSRSHSDVPKGRPLSSSQIKSPQPVAPHATRTILDADYEVDELAEQFAAHELESDDDSDLSYRSSPSSSVSGYSTPASDCSDCSCERYGITRKGERVRLDCGGSRCGYDGSSCSSESEEEYVSPTSSRRNGVVMRR